MAKSAIPMPKAGGGAVPKLLGVLVLIAIVAMVVQHPADSAHWVSQTMGTLGHVIDGLATFLRAVME